MRFWSGRPSDVAFGWSVAALKSDPAAMCKRDRAACRRKALDSTEMRHKRPLPALLICLIRDLKRARSPMNQPQITPELVASHGLKPDEYERILKLIGRVPSFTELGIFSAMWNEHCSYKSSRLHLRGLPTKAPWVIQGPGENAGVIDIGDGQAVVFKMESHNHPSYIEPYQGATTG